MHEQRAVQQRDHRRRRATVDRIQPRRAVLVCPFVDDDPLHEAKAGVHCLDRLARRLVRLLEGDGEDGLRLGAQPIKMLLQVRLDRVRSHLGDEGPVVAAVAIEYAVDLRQCASSGVGPAAVWVRGGGAW